MTHADTATSSDPTPAVPKQSPAAPHTTDTERIELRTPAVADGKHMWTLARDSKVLDLNTSYAYLLWARDFSRTSVLATLDGTPAGFVTGYMRPDAPDTLMIWQVAVDEASRGHGLAGRMLDELAQRTGAARLETTITADNEASQRLFTSFAARHGADCTHSPLFVPEDYPDGHDTEHLYEIAPLT
ncbi:diaminobutyrate acetyltransferase [Brevibacterium yomogidense]|uniref:diaminobutyrate acetyltransferase n=1 Tax=Brevibacterium yomogidense TaxID=946573 RepID=UPI0018DF75C7